MTSRRLHGGHDDPHWRWSPARLRTRSDLAAALRAIRAESGLGYQRYEIKGKRVGQHGDVPIADPALAANPLPRSSLHRAVDGGQVEWFAAQPARLAVFLHVSGCPAGEVGSWLTRLRQLAGSRGENAADLAADLDRLASVIAVDHERLFGVDNELARLGELLANRRGDRVLSIVGDAGVGKTALAYELVLRHAQQAGFARAAAVSAKFSHLDSAGTPGADLPIGMVVDWRDLLVDVARQLQLPVDLRPDAIEEQLPAAMPDEPCLIMVDNLETVPEAQLAVQYLTGSGLLGQGPAGRAGVGLARHKVVLTSRAAVAQQAPYRIRERRWTGPDRPAARAYASYLAGDDPTLDPSPEDLDDVVDAAERVPLLIKIIVSQAIFRRLPVREVIGRLRQRGGELGAAVWQFCYVDSLDALAARVGESVAVALMSVFCAKAPGSAFTSVELGDLSQLSAAEFEQAVAVACQLSLVRSLSGNTRFTVHSLLREFYCGGIDDGAH